AEAALLAPLPLPALRLDATARAGLESVGLKTAGAIMAAPRAPLVRRFGVTLMLRLDQALGRLEEAVSPRLPVASLSVERQLAEPIGLVEDIERLVLLLAETLKSELERRGEGARRLELRLFRVDGAVSRVGIATARALREPRLIQKLFHEKLAAIGDELDAGYGFDLLRLSVLASADIAETQTDLSGEAADEADDIALFADRIRARLGPDAIVQPVLAPSHLPERAVGFAPGGEQPLNGVGGKAGNAGQRVRAPVRPLRLFRHPEPVEVTSEVPEGPPLNFRWRRALYRVARSEGPERIAPEWWRADGLPAVTAATPDNREGAGEAWSDGAGMDGEERHDDTAFLTRDYFRIEDPAGRRYWLFREGFYGDVGRPPRWFVHGVFA
ncbi:MAG: DNA polymerase Y family protein, partial [Mesorhizobium sp.]|nr:DNA polymerase Y family protein [Mesorhizobium sp.]